VRQRNGLEWSDRNNCFASVIQGVAKLTPEDLALLEKIFARVCERRGSLQTPPLAQESANVVISLHQSKIRNRFRLEAMLTGKRCP